MTDSFMKLRGKGSFGGRFGNQAGKRRKTASGKGSEGKRTRFPDGKYESWWPTEIAIWINISPFQLFEQEVYDRDEKEVIDVVTTWWEYNSHWIPSKRRKFVCSTGAHRTEPCYGCARRQQHWDRLDAIEEEKGYRPDDKPDVGRSTNFALGITIMEKIYSIPKRDDRGKIRKTKNNKIIYSHLAAPLVDDDVLESGVDFPQKFGHRAHWSLGVEHRDQLLEEDEKLLGFCGNCAGEMLATGRICPDCETSVEFDSPIRGEDLIQARNKRFHCRACQYKGNWVIQYACPDCGNPKEGGLTKFDIRVKKVRSGEKSVIKIVEIRVPTQDEEVQKLIQNPLKVDEIFAPDDLKFQKLLLGDKVQGLDPTYGAFTKDYGSDDEGEEGGVQF